MAQVAAAPVTDTRARARWSASQTRAQFAAVSSLRWHIFRNGLRRKSSVGDLIALLIVVPLFLGFTLVPSVIAGFISSYAVTSHRFQYIGFTLWGVFLLCQLASIQLGQPGTTFDPTQLIRFPLSFRRYTTIRIFFGLLSPANILGSLASVSIAIGVTIAQPSLGLFAFLGAMAFALTNVIFTRMVFSWVDRWLSTRRAREVFTGLIFLFSFGVQYANFTFNPAFQHANHDSAALQHRIALATSVYHSARPVLALLPPGLVADALAAANRHNTLGFTLNISGVLLYAALFLAIFAMRIYQEFRGENLSEAANAVVPAAPRRAAAETPSAAPATFQAPPTIAATLHKELLYIRRNSGIFYSFFAPLIMVVLFVSRVSLRTAPGFVFASAVAYTLLGIVPITYNSLGIEAAGVQFYFLAPIRMRDVFLAKNLVHFLLAAMEVIAVLVTVSFAGKAPSPPMVASVVLWAAFSMFISLSVGNYRSIVAPKKLDPGKMQSKQTAPLSALLSIVVLLGCALLGAAIIFLANNLSRPWILMPAAFLFACIGFVIYLRCLASLDSVIARSRDNLSAELCKAS